MVGTSLIAEAHEAERCSTNTALAPCARGEGARPAATESLVRSCAGADTPRVASPPAPYGWGIPERASMTRGEGAAQQMQMNHIERLFAASLFRMKVADLTDNAFQDFFDLIMSLTDASYIAIKSAGKLGDLSADGLSVDRRELYACYAPQTFDAREASRKFRSDLAGAVAKRSEAFSTFIFAHNDRRGLHPTVSEEMSEARARYPDLSFQECNTARLRGRFLSLPRAEAEDVLGRPLPVDMVVSVGVEDLTELLEDLEARSTPVAGPLDAPLEVPADKLETNRFSPETEDEIVRGLKESPRISAYYEMRRDPEEKEDVAARINEEYRRIRQETEDSETIWFLLETWVMGNQLQAIARRRACSAILAHFFEQCDIFERPIGSRASERAVR